MADVLPRRVYLAIGEVLTHPRFHPVHRRFYRWGRGRGVLGRALGVDMILVTVTARSSRRLRTIPLAAVPDGAGWIIVGSNGGKAFAPAWADDLRSTPHAVVQHRAHAAPFQARELTHGPDRDRAWSIATAAYPGFEVYRTRTERPIPLFRLEPVGEG